MKPADIFVKSKIKEQKEIPDIKPGDIVKIYETISEEKGKKAQIFEGVVLARKHKKEAGATITVRRIIDRIGVEKIFPILSPAIQKIEIVRRAKVRRAKLYYLRNLSKKKARLKKKEDPIVPEMHQSPQEQSGEEKKAPENIN